MDTQDKKAGAVLLKDLELFNRTCLFLETQVEPLVLSEVYRAVKAWATKNGWECSADGSGSLWEIWVAPKAWKIADDEWWAWFGFGERADSNSDSYEIADLFGVGQTDWGVRFVIDYDQFGGKTKWNSFIKKVPQQNEILKSGGWINEGKGSFFLPLEMKHQLLVEAWEKHNWKAALAPISEALDGVAKIWGQFDAILDKGSLAKRKKIKNRGHLIRTKFR